MKAKLVEQLLSEYSAQRQSNLSEQERRKTEVTRADAHIERLLAERSGLFIQAMKRSMADPAGTQNAMEAARARARTIDKEVCERLVNARLSVDYLEPIYRCALCQDTGFVGEPIKRRCECFEKRLFERMLAAAGLDAGQAQGFDSFDASCVPDEAPEGSRLSQREIAQRACQIMRRYAESFPNTETLNILLTGDSGLGKTFLMDCTAGRVVERGFMVMKLTSYQMSEAMRAHHSISGTSDERFEMMMECDMLCLDDLGSEPMLENLTIPHLYTLINERLAARKHTLIATNLTPQGIARRYTERVASRLLDTQRAQVVRLIGRDIRLSRR